MIVVDNGSRDGTAEVAARLGASVVREPTPGYGAAVHAGVEAATRDYLAVMDGDGSFDPDDLLPLLRPGAGRRRRPRRRPPPPGPRAVWPWHARAGNALVVAWLRRRIGMAAHDIAPMRVCRRQAMLDLGVADRRFGYPVELLQRATDAGWRVHEQDVGYHPRAAGHAEQGVRVGARHAPDGARLRAGAAMTRVLVVAKAPVAGRAKTRLGADVGLDAAAELAAASPARRARRVDAAVGARQLSPRPVR